MQTPQRYSVGIALLALVGILGIYLLSPLSALNAQVGQVVKLVSQCGLVVLLALAVNWWIGWRSARAPLVKRWFESELEQIGHLQERLILDEDQAAYVVNCWREVTRVQGNFIRVRDRFTWTKVVTIGAAAFTACSAGLTTYGRYNLRLLTVAASFITVIASSLRTEYGTDSAEWAHHRIWSVRYQRMIRDYMNLTGPYRRFADQKEAFKTFVEEFENARLRQVDEFFQLIAAAPKRSTGTTSVDESEGASEDPGGADRAFDP